MENEEVLHQQTAIYDERKKKLWQDEGLFVRKQVSLICHEPDDR